MKPIPSAPGYFADANGDIWRDGRRLKPTSNGRGYLRLKLCFEGKRVDVYVHRVVCEAYSGPCPEGMQCRHLDGCRANNKPDNLQWSDKATNEADKVAHGTLTRGERHYKTELTDDIVAEARKRAATGESVKAIARELGVDRARLCDAVRGRTWRHMQEPAAVVNLMRGWQRVSREKRIARLASEKIGCCY